MLETLTKTKNSFAAFTPLRDYLLPQNSEIVCHSERQSPCHSERQSPCHSERQSPCHLERELPCHPERSVPEVRAVEGPLPEVEPRDNDDAAMDVVAEARRFSANVEESVERVAERLLREFACEVLGRELLLAPIDTQAILQRLLAEIDDSAIVRIRMHPKDATLQPGDIVIELRDGVVDARLSVRLEEALRKAGAA